MEREGGMIADALECKQSLTGLAGLTGDTASCCLDFASLLEQHQPQQAYPLSVEKLGIKSLQFYHPYCDLKELLPQEFNHYIMALPIITLLSPPRFFRINSSVSLLISS